jgi:hypothetical protein
MSRGGYVTSMVGGVLALVFAMLMLLTSFLWAVGGDLSRFFEERGDRVGSMWKLLGRYHGVDDFPQDDLGEYVTEYKAALEETGSEDLEALADKYDSAAFRDMAAIVAKVEALRVRLIVGMVLSALASVAALIGAQVARVRLKAGAVTVLCASILTLGFSLLAGSVLPMAVASLLLLIGSLVLLNGRGEAQPDEPERGWEVE